MLTPVRQQSVGIIGAGPAGLITGYTLLRDGFTNVQLLTRDKSPGGVWAKDRIYPGVSINSVHGEFKFSPLPMPPPLLRATLGNRHCGEDITAYMETFADVFLLGHIRYETEVLEVRRARAGVDVDVGWDVEVRDLRSGTRAVLHFTRVVLCTGGCSRAFVPEALSAASAERAGFRGVVVHTSEVTSHLDRILNEAQTNPDYTVVVIGGGKSAQDISAHVARHGVGVSIVFEKADAVMASRTQLPDWIRKSRLIGILSPHIELRTRLERFLHTTTLGGMFTRAFWNFLTRSAFAVLKIPKESPLRNAHSLFWGTHNNDEGTGRKDGFHALVNQGRIRLVAPTRAEGYAPDGESIVLRDGQTLRADVVILATGFSSSWEGIFMEKTMEELGMARHAPSQNIDEWTHYTSLASPPPPHPQSALWAPSNYRGIVPAKNIMKRDFAINGAVFASNRGYGFEVIANWISSYFLGDKMRLPCTVEAAVAETERNAAWMRKRYPGTLSWMNESYSSRLALFTWTQVMDELLDDMGVPSMRSGGNWLTWPFKVVSVSEIATLHEERRAK